MKRNGVLALCFLLSACSSKLSGEYVSADGSLTYRFESGERVHISGQEGETELKYEIYDRRIQIETPRGSQILILMEDGSLQGTRGIRLVKKG